MWANVVRTTAVALALAPALAGCGERAAGGGGDDTGAGAPPTTLYLAAFGEMWVVDVDAERVEHVRMPELESGGDPPHLIASVGDRLAIWDYDIVSVPADDPSAPPQTLADDGWIFIPAADPDRIWVGFLDRDSPPTERGLGELREIDADGNVITRGIEPPGGAWPYAELTGGLLFQGEAGTRLWDPDTGRTVRSFSWQEIGDAGPVSGDLLASCSEDCAELILTDFASGEQRRIAAPGGLAFVAFEAEFSPDGDSLAVPVKEAGGGWKSYSTYDRELALVDLEAGTTEVLPGSSVPSGYVYTAWSPDGEEVFMTGGDFDTDRVIAAYRVGEEAARTLDVRVGDFYGMVAG